MKIQKAAEPDLPAIARMAASMWRSHTAEELCDEFARMLADPECGIFLLCADGQAVGFAQCGLRHDYVEGTSGSPVGYLEGIYVEPVYRHQGGAKHLLSACETWANSMGCTEFASDCELDNAASLQFHLNVGFSEANRIICFTKKL